MEENQGSLQRLIRAIALSQGQFALILVRCNYRQLQEQIMLSFRSLNQDKYVREVVLSPSTTTLHNSLFQVLYPENADLAIDSFPSGLMVFGLESVISIEDLLTGFNQARDIYAHYFPFPLVLWLTDELAMLLSRLAPDFKSWAATTIKFEMAQQDLMALVRKETESLFDKVIEAGVKKFLPNTDLDLAPKSQHRKEIEAARQDLFRVYNVTLETDLEAGLEFVLGRDYYARDEIDNALSHYQRSLTLWEEQLRFEEISSNSSPYFLKYSIVLFHLGLCYLRMADLRPSVSNRYWRDALIWFQKCLDILETIDRKDLIAKFILLACEILKNLQAWEDLEKLACKSLELHQTYGTQAQIAQDYGFLSVVNASKANWIKAYELAERALNIAEGVSDDLRQQESWYLLLLGRAQRHLGECSDAINNLEWAKIVCELQYNPSLYLEIVQELHSFYFFKERNYSEAFKLKQEKIQIEHQYGFRAFIGASQLQPQRYRINPIHSSQEIASFPEEVAWEISTSGRQQDVNRLIERMTRADCKLTVIHGSSGVGKSSLVKAGLLPALKQKVIGDRLPITVCVSIYNDWELTIFRNINSSITNDEDIKYSDNYILGIVQKIRLATNRNYIVILIFDQFEEFFFVNAESQLRKEFYNFLLECLNIPFVKVILSMREDYLHYLLELERYSYYQRNERDLGIINGDILDKDLRYYLSKFSREDAINIIKALTQHSYYEAEDRLINKLVEDLAGEVDEVHPIELQIVGAQLQSENITTLEDYLRCGGSEKLIQRWLEEVIKDCGAENEYRSWQLLFELTHEKGIRPLKTKAELFSALAKEEEKNDNCFSSDTHSFLSLSSNLELILEILVGSGLVLRMREESGDRYQLVHDYLVEPIRKKNTYKMTAELQKIIFEKDKAEIAQKLSQQRLNSILKRRLREARLVGCLLTFLLATIGGLGWNANLQRRAAVRQTLRAERSETNLKISALTAASEALFASNKEFDALLESLRAFRKMKQTQNVLPDTQMRVVTALQQAVYGVTEVNRMEGHQDIVWSVNFSPDGELLASGSTDRTIKLWRRDGFLFQTLKGHSSAITSLTFSPDGQTLASASLDKTIKIWRRNSIAGTFDLVPYKTFEHKDWVYSVSFSPDGKILASTSKDGSVYLWRTDGTLVNILQGHKSWVNWLCFSPDGKFIASVSDDKTIKIWRRDGSLVKTLVGHQKGVTAVAFSPNGQMLASAGRDKTVKLWRWANSENRDGLNISLYKTLQHHSATIWSVGFSHNSQQLASAGDDNTINLWNASGTLIRSFKGHSDAVASVAFSPDNKFLVSASYDKTIKQWSLESPRLPVLKGHTDRVLSVAWRPDGKMLASGSRDRTIKLWMRSGYGSSMTTRLYKTLTGHKDRVPSVSFDPSGKILASGSYDKTIKLWRNDGTLLKTLRGHNDSVMSVSFSSDGMLLASGSKDKTVKLWNREGKLLATLEGHNGWVNSVNFSPDGQVLASASDDQTVKLWRRDGTLLKTFSPHEGWVMGVGFSPTDHLLASASWDNTVRLWKWDGKLLKTLLKGYSDSVNAVTFSPNGEMIAAASWDSTVKLWSRDGKLIKILNGHQAPVLGTSFSPDGETLASASDDNTIILWNLDIHDLLDRGCYWVENYLKYNRNVDQSDRRLCSDQ
jgi:WD40 repeat protein